MRDPDEVYFFILHLLALCTLFQIGCYAVQFIIHHVRII